MAKKKAPPTKAARPPAKGNGQMDARTEAVARQMGSEFEPNAPSRAKGGRKKNKPDPPDGPREKQSRKARMLDNRIMRADKRYKKWSERFECKHLDDYYEGEQWRGVPEEQAKMKYVINMIFATVETQLPSLLFSRPRVECEARPDHQWTDRSKASARATLIEQTLQTRVDDPKTFFTHETSLALRDAYSRFGMVEVGYSAEWLDNPNAGKPILDDEGKAMLDPDDDSEDEVYLSEAEKKLAPGSTEMLYLVRVPAWAFRASPGTNRLDRNDWVGYYTWERIADLKSNPDYENTDTLKSSASFWAERDDDYDSDEHDHERGSRRGMCRVWRIWDLRQRTRIVHAEGHTKFLQERPFDFLPLAGIKFFERKDDYYPLPPIYNWMSPQDEINETREMQKVHRRRALRRYMVDPKVKPEEREKLETGEDMVMIEVPDIGTGHKPIQPIEDAPLDAQNWRELAETEKDLNTIAGVTGEDRNQPSSPTATQANIVNTKASIRESHARTIVANWLGEICRLMLLTMRENFKGEFMVKQGVDPFTFANAKQTEEQAELWREIDTEDIDDLDVDVSIDVSSLSPVAEDAQRNAWNVVLTLLTNPNLASLLFVPNPNAPDDPSPLLRKTLRLNGVRSDQEIREIWRVGQELLKQAAAAEQAKAAQAKMPEPMKLSFAIKGDDFANPSLRPILMAILMREENLSGMAAQIATPMPPMMGDGGDANALEMPGPATGRAAGNPTPGVQ
jgi:hypothetical protein